VFQNMLFLSQKILKTIRFELIERFSLKKWPS